MCLDALSRNESCGGHFRSEHQTKDGEAKRNDDDFCHVATWQHQKDSDKPKFNKEDLVFENVKLETRSYK